MHQILLAEDEPDLRSLMTLVLSEIGFNVVEASDGLEAIHILSNDTFSHFSLIISDVQMPNTGGLDLYRYCKTEKKDIPFIFITGNPYGRDAEELRKTFKATIVEKPLNFDELSSVVKRACQL